MAFAKLSYAVDGSVRSTTVLHDIVGVITGQFTNVNQLTGAIAAQSEIINTENKNWNILHPAGSFVPSTPNINVASWVLTAPCINPSKTKFIRLTNVISSNVITHTGAVANNTYTNANGITLTACTDAINSTTLTNETWRNTNSGPATSAFIRGSTIYISWSDRYVFIYSPYFNSTSGTISGGMRSYIEFPETPVTQGSNTVPTVMLVESGSYLNYAGALIIPGSTNASSISVAIVPNFYTVGTNSSGMFSVSDGISASDKRLSTAISNGLMPTVSTIDRFGNNRINIMPMTIHASSFGHAPFYLSVFSNIYIVPQNLGSFGETISVGGDLYTYLPTPGFCFIIKRA